MTRTGFPSEGATPYSDAHHLRPTQNLINSYRANSDFGEVDGLANVKTDGYGNKWTNSIFEPRDEVKGDVLFHPVSDISEVIAIAFPGESSRRLDKAILRTLEEKRRKEAEDARERESAKQAMAFNRMN